ncbi:lysophospholipid acyltransferase family protein [Bacillus norwichensis]|uniref:1-acyl-sn-glycerol-3-phosphate acyltransferase n=1 Tax=Bacillus norwichensis TaxID=2762217 RepID=A0ABR8VNT7_9BACI|nr:lysophospholipid acyltransferase family protein [Bacillus norwichensis]MBD8006382.1 1-acyl-sn-glycerol-3-phosphate acyltransferase [Bacillus norwichensis]
MTFYHFARAVVKGLLSPFYRIEVKGLENFPESDGVLLCTNHISNLDPPVVGITCPRPVSFMAKEELFRVPILKSILPNVKAFPVKRGMSDRGALRTGLALLKEGEVLGLFPEGTRSKTGEIGKGLAGAGFFALRSDAKIIPCAIIGPYKTFGKLRVVYGKPIDFSELKKEKVSVEAATEIIMNEIKKLTETH